LCAPWSQPVRIRQTAGVRVHDLRTPCLIVDAATLDHNLTAMAAALPGRRLRPHVKAHKCTALARRQAALGHRGFTCATVREMEGLAAAGLGDDLLLANEVVDPERLATAAALEARGARVTVAVDSDATIEAAAAAGIREVLIDVDVGLPRCGCAPGEAGRLADRARKLGLEVRGVMGYEGLATIVPDPDERRPVVEEAMSRLAAAHEAVGGDVVSAGSTVTYAMNDTATEVQAGSYALMDTTFAAFEDLPFRLALSLWTTVISVNPKGYAVCDGGLKSLGMDHGNPTIEGRRVLVVSDEHITFSWGGDHGPAPAVGDRVRVLPAHVDPTVAYHERLWVVDGEEVVDCWPVDLRGW
jgi:D-serine deaminase-like pyridoxal phosphate-dependent protein